METLEKTTLRFGIKVGLTLGAIVGLVGCGEMQDDALAPEDDALVSANGLNMFNGLSMLNGLTLANGLTLSNGYASSNGLNSSTA